MVDKSLLIHPEIREALDEGAAVVALESTIISHGMPYPQSVETALRCMDIVRENGAIPATIGILKGKLKIGLNHSEIEILAQSKDVQKVSRRDLPFVVTKALNGSTTVASTMILSHMAGIPVFVTGGIGGVHRGAQRTFDVSADLMELAQTDVAVVCGGCKSILDIGLTLEYLETHGVPVVGFQTDEFPAFYTRKSGFRVDYRVDSPEELAQAIQAKWALNLRGGLVISNPIPEDFAMSQDQINEAIDEAVEKAEHQDVRGKNVTPFLLAEIEKFTHGQSLQTNQELIYNNSKLGAKLAVSLAKLKSENLLST
jgi:pseudouridylate synthase